MVTPKNENPDPKQGEKPVAVVQISLYDDGRLEMEGAIPNATTFFGMLELAKQQQIAGYTIQQLKAGNTAIAKPSEDAIADIEKSRRG